MKERSRIGMDKHDKKNDIESQNDKLLIEKLNKELAEKNNEIKLLQTKFIDSQDRIHDIIIEKDSLKKQINQYELKELELQIGKFEELKNNYNKLEHRLNITKKQLDEARNQIIFHRQVIEDLENRSFMDYLRNRFPESFVDYKEK
jgi:chromosome segregation ATPase